jgi:hypothetical protein
MNPKAAASRILDFQRVAGELEALEAPPADLTYVRK